MFCVHSFIIIFKVIIIITITFMMFIIFISYCCYFLVYNFYKGYYLQPAEMLKPFPNHQDIFCTSFFQQMELFQYS